MSRPERAVRARSTAVAVLVAVLVGLLPSGAGVAAQRAPTPPIDPPPHPGTAEVPTDWPVAPPVTASSHVLVDAATGQVVAARDADTRRAVASTVKILTAVTVLRRSAPGDVVTVGAEVAGIGGASVGLRPGDRWTVAELLDGLIARSGNDAATALAVHVGGSVEGFVALMRRDAAEMGLDGVVISSPSGLEDRNRFSARDLAVISRVAMMDPVFRAIAAEPVVTLPSGVAQSRNELLTTYPGAIGIKTGFTERAGYCLVGAARRGERELIVVVLDSRDAQARFTDAAALLDHGFDGFTAVEVGGELSLKVPGDEIELDAGPADALVPAASPTLAVTPLLPIEAETVPERVVASWDGATVLALPIEVTAASDDRAARGAGAILLDRVYAAMRAATLADAWPGSPR